MAFMCQGWIDESAKLRRSRWNRHRYGVQCLFSTCWECLNLGSLRIRHWVKDCRANSLFYRKWKHWKGSKDVRPGKQGSQFGVNNQARSYCGQGELGLSRETLRVSTEHTPPRPATGWGCSQGAFIPCLCHEDSQRKPSKKGGGKKILAVWHWSGVY